MKLFRSIITLSVLLLFGLSAFAQWTWNDKKPRTGSPQGTLVDRTNMAGMSGMEPSLEVALLNKDQNADQKKAAVKVETWGVNMIPPDSNRPPRLTEAYILYRMDDQPVVRSDKKEHTFTDLKPGWHSITVQLAASNGEPIWARMILNVHIPK